MSAFRRKADVLCRAHRLPFLTQSGHLTPSRKIVITHRTCDLPRLWSRMSALTCAENIAGKFSAKRGSGLLLSQRMARGMVTGLRRNSNLPIRTRSPFLLNVAGTTPTPRPGFRKRRQRAECCAFEHDRSVDASDPAGRVKCLARRVSRRHDEQRNVAQASDLDPAVPAISRSGSR